MRSRMLADRGSRSRKIRSRFFTEGFDLECRTLLSVVDVLSYRDAQPNTNYQPNTGLNTSETSLQPSNVNLNTFGKQFETQVDGQVYAQPLVKTSVNITVGSEPGLHNVVFVATQHDSLYAMDATSGHILWKDSFIDPAHGITTVTATDVGSSDITPEIGITSTPVIDPKTNILYLVAKSKVVREVGADYLLTMHAINLADGTEALGGPVVMADTYWDGLDASVYGYVSGPSVLGTGDGSVGGLVSFNALRALQRCALTLYNDQVYVMTASHGDAPPYHGWILGYSTANLSLTTVFNATPNGIDGGFWESGAGIAIDPQGFLYVATGNGTFDTSFDANGLPILGNYGNTLLKLAIDPTYTRTVNGWGLKVVDFFTPSNQDLLDAIDADFGSSGPMILPDSAGSAAHPHLMTVMGKETRMFLVDRDNMGKFNPGGEQVVQILSNNLNSSFASPAFAGSTMYIATRGDVNKAFTIANGAIQAPATSQSRQTFGYPGANPSLSFNGSSYGIEWLLDPTSSQLFAFNANDLLNPLYGSNQAAGNRDSLTSVTKFDVPVVANGMVYVGTSTSIAGFGLFPNPPTSASFVNKNTTTQGSWNDAYGTEGFSISQDPSVNNPSLPYNVTVNVSQATPIVWNGSTTDPRALLKAAPNATDNIAAAWSGSSFAIDVRINDGLTHQIALYGLDWDNQGRNETVQLINDATGAVLDTQTISSFQNGTYLVWNVQGNVTFKVTSNNATPAVISGLFFGGRVPVPGSASFVKQDTSTLGTWKPAYGADGFNVAQDPSANNPSIPAYAQVKISNNLNYTWTASTSNLSALQSAAAGSTNRIAAIWYADNSFNIDVKISDGKTHQVALYALDWDSTTRAESIQVISDVTGQVLDTQSLANYHAGVYAVWNISGDVTFKIIDTGTSNSVISGIFFSTPPAVTRQPANVTVSAGSTATFNATAAGNPAPDVQWQSRTNSGSSWANIAGATTATYTTASTSAANSGTQYRAVFTSTAGTATTTAAILTVSGAPTITTQPASVAVNAGSTATFTAAASGTPSPSLQWQVSSNAGKTWTNLAGAISTSYTTAVTTEAQNGIQYRAIFTNGAGSATTATALLTVNYAPAVVTPPADTMVNAGSTATFTASASGNPTPAVQWQSSTNSGSTWTNIAGATLPGYTTPVTLAVNNGTQYRAVFTNSVGTATSAVATLTVNSAPAVTTQPASVTVTAGSTATFTAAASGNPTPTVQWQFSTNSGSSWTNISGATSATYTTPATVAGNTGTQYRALFTNAVGTATSAVATLTVQGSSSDSALFTKLDTTTQGTWKPSYGAEGYNVSQDYGGNNPVAPAYATVTFSNALNATWNSSTTEVRALQKAALNSTTRIAGTWYADSSFTIKVQASDSNLHQVALYALDYDKVGRSETIQVLSTATGAVLDSRSISSFQNGVYLVWNITGSVTFKVTNTGPANAVLSGLFFGSAPNTGTTASFTRQDTTTQGTWKPSYGADGFDVSQDTNANNPGFPAYASVGFSGANNAVWTTSTTDVRALQKTAVSSTDRIAGTWYNDTSFSISVELKDGAIHQVALYVLDYDKVGRSETIQVINNSTGTVLDTRSLASFGNGVYMVWNVSGSVTFKVTNTGPANAVLSGLFFGTAPSSSTNASFLKQDATTQGTWKTKYGSDGYSINQDPSANNPSLPSYASFSVASAANFVWNPSTTNVRALQKASLGATDRLAATWFNGDAFSMNVGINDGKSHTVALYALDWDNSGRTQMIQVIDSTTYAVLDTRSLAAFQNGVYLVWNITGNVTFKVINTGSGNAVISGIFFG